MVNCYSVWYEGELFCLMECTKMFSLAIIANCVTVIWLHFVPTNNAAKSTTELETGHVK